MKVCVLNAISLNMISKEAEKGEVNLVVNEISIDEVRRILEERDFISGIGHMAMSQFLTQKLGLDIPFNRAFIELAKGDIGIVAQVTQRLPEGTILSRDEVEQIGVKFYLVKVV